MSLLHFLFYLRSGGTLDRLVATSGGAQESRLEGGSQRLASLLADQLSDVVRLGAPSPPSAKTMGRGCDATTAAA